ncbi:hypothetical protein SSX86_021658 [Deinandra increscens subsp. villosa]|uniref:Uncharacterized protein n=1 Tax=Deinandra increscens subsp. villosa TaxID=3103831 RepID=A0AAP0GSS7_9ASTR
MANTVAELVFIPAPGVGHIMSTIELAKLLVSRDQKLSINVLLINPPYSVAPLTAYITSLANNTIERIRFTQLPQDQTPPKLDPKAFVTSMYEFINSHCKYVRDIMVNQTGSYGVAGKVDDKDVFRWLDVQPPSTAVVLCFGSMGSFNEVQVKEIACSLERCGHRFVWSLRLPPLQEQSLHMHDDDARMLLPNGFLKRTMGIGKVIGWASQVALLAHEAVGGFVSHCGWNSMLESLWFGVPTATWPLYAEQQLNAFEMLVELRLTVDLKMDYKMDVFNSHTNKVIVTSEGAVAELVFIPAPGVGHIMSIIEMAKLLVNRDQSLSVNVLLINPPYPDLALTTYIESLAKNTIERIRFTRLPQDQTQPKLDPKAFMTSFYEFINSHCRCVRDIVADMINIQTGSSRVVGFIVDMFCVGMIDVANEFNVPTYVFFTSSAAFLGFNMYVETLCLDRNQDHVIDMSKSEGEMVVPSFVNPMPMKVFPTAYYIHNQLDFLISSFPKVREAKGIMVNTFLELETHAIMSFSNTNFPPVYPVGPVLNLDGVTGKVDDKDVFKWLDVQPPSSVVVLCFGSMGSFNEVQVKEIACGLERCGHRFVWSLRLPPLQEQSLHAHDNDARMLLPNGFLKRTMGIGKVIGWAPQAALLAHEAVGGFVSHCGWNSMLESMWFGVPTATWPLYAEQQLNAFEMVVELRLAVDLKMDYKMDVFNPHTNKVIVTAEEVEGGIRRLMKDNEVRAKVKEISKLSKATVSKGGSSFTSVDYLVKEIKSNTI